MKEAFVKLFKVKSLMTLLVAATFTYGFFKGIISGEQFMTVATMVFTFYFAKQGNQ